MSWNFFWHLSVSTIMVLLAHPNPVQLFNSGRTWWQQGLHCFECMLYRLQCHWETYHLICINTCHVLTFFPSGTGVVTSVPSDAPDDIAALRDIKKKEVRRIPKNKSTPLKHWQQSPYETCGEIKIVSCFNRLCSLIRLLCYLLKFRWTKPIIPEDKMLPFNETVMKHGYILQC